jgi:hypothetical protein
MNADEAQMAADEKLNGFRVTLDVARNSLSLYLRPSALHLRSSASTALVR